MKRTLLACSLAAAGLLAAPAVFADAAPKPLKALLLLGGCCHDYAQQKDILKKGIEARANVVVEIVYSDNTTETPPLPIYGNAKYADGYDVVIHDECSAKVKDLKVVEGVLAPHKAGLPGVNLHCGMHSYRTAANIALPVKPGSDESLWFDYTGVHTFRHGAQKPIKITFTDRSHPAVFGLDDWTTIKEELYNNVDIREGVQVLARGMQEPNNRPNESESAVVWTHLYGEKKARVFSTTIGHNNETVSDPRYLDLVTRGVLWACGKIDDAGKIAEGYGPKK